MDRPSARSFLFVGLAWGAALPATAQNQAVNPGFVTDLSGWTMLSDPAFTATHDTCQSFNSPGSLRVSTTGPTAVAFVAVRQYLVVAPGQVMDYGGKYRFESGHAANLKGSATAAFFASVNCTGAFTGGPFTNIITDIPNTWLPIHANNVTVPPGQNSAFFQLVITPAAGEGVGWFDDVYFGPDPLTPVELIDFAVE